MITITGGLAGGETGGGREEEYLEYLRGRMSSLERDDPSAYECFVADAGARLARLIRLGLEWDNEALESLMFLWFEEYFSVRQGVSVLSADEWRVLTGLAEPAGGFN